MTIYTESRYWLVLLLAMLVIEKIIKYKNRYCRIIRLAYSGLKICLKEAALLFGSVKFTQVLSKIKKSLF